MPIPVQPFVSLLCQEFLHKLDDAKSNADPPCAMVELNARLVDGDKYTG